MLPIDIGKLQNDFSHLSSLKVEEKPHLDGEWWQTSVFNLNEVAPIIGAQARLNKVICIMSLRNQFPGVCLDDLKRFAEWCDKTSSIFPFTAG